MTYRQLALLLARRAGIDAFGDVAWKTALCAVDFRPMDVSVEWVVVYVHHSR